MITIKIFIITVTILLTFTLYITLGINDFQPRKRQLFAVLPLLALLLTLYRMDNIPPLAYDKVENDNTYETPTQKEEVINVEVPVTVTQSKPIEMVEQQLQLKDQKVINIPTIQNEIKSSQIEKGSLLKQTTKSLPFAVVAGLLLNLNPQTVFQ